MKALVFVIVLIAVILGLLSLGERPAIATGDRVVVKSTEFPPRAATTASTSETLQPEHFPHSNPSTELASERTKPEASAGQPPGDPRFSRELMDYARQQFLQGWSKVRQPSPLQSDRAQGMEEFQAEVVALPARLGEKLAKQRNEEDRAAKAFHEGDALTALDLLDRGRFSVNEELLSGSFLDQATLARGSGNAMKGAEFKPNKLVAGLTLEFGPGVHRLKDAHFRGEDGRQIPPDITIQGTGINGTLLYLDEIGADKDVIRLNYRDITIHTDNNYAFDLRSGGLAVNMERTRVIGFDMGSGQSVLFSVRKGILVRAVDCEFMGGYGRNPIHGNFMSGSPMVGRFLNCRFERLRLDLRLKSGGILFQGCVFSQLYPQGYPERQDGGDKISFVNCLVEKTLEGEVWYKARQDHSLDLNIKDLFPSAEQSR